MNRAIFLDRDGTINVEKHYLHKIEDFEYIDGAIKAMRILQQGEFKLFIISNQSGVARGYYSEEDVRILNEWLISDLQNYGVHIEKIYYCPHLPNAPIEKYRVDCDCRKPKLGLFFRAVEKFDIDLQNSYAIGDKLRDCEICLKTECRGFLINTTEDKDVTEKVKNNFYKNITYAEDLLTAANKIINK